MIKFHPTDELLTQYVDGQLPASLAAAIAIHTEMCPHCSKAIAAKTQTQAADIFSCGENQLNEDHFDISFDSLDMLDNITSDDSLVEPSDAAQLSIEVKNQQFKLPRALNSMEINKFSGIGKISRAKVELGEGQVHTHLLYMAPNGEVPQHTHKGFELTLLLDGTFKDDMGEYTPGDFILLDGEHQHSPMSEQGCLCLTVVSDALHFTQGISKLLNPLGKLIY